MPVDKLKVVSVTTSIKNYDGTTHQFFGICTVLSEAEGPRCVCNHLKRAFERTAFRTKN
jgi:hypothetical protein